MQSQESELLTITFEDTEVSDFRNLMVEIVRATKEPGFKRLKLSKDADRSLSAVMDELTKR